MGEMNLISTLCTVSYQFYQQITSKKKINNGKVTDNINVNISKFNFFKKFCRQLEEESGKLPRTANGRIFKNEEIRCFKTEGKYCERNGGNL